MKQVPEVSVCFLLICCGFTPALRHVVAVVAYENSLFNTVGCGKLIYKFGAVADELDFVCNFEIALCNSLGLDCGFLCAFLDDGSGLLLCCVIVAFNNENVIAVRGLRTNEDEEDNADDSGTDNSKRVHACAENDTYTDCPEKIYNVKGILDCGTESYDGERTDHTEGQNDVGGNSEDDEGGDHRESDEGYAEGLGEHNALIGLLVDEVNEHTERIRKNEGDERVKDGELYRSLHEAILKDIIK